MRVGDRVRVRWDLKAGTFYDGIYVVDEMARYAGELVEITDVLDYDRYRVNGTSEDGFLWSGEMFDKSAETGYMTMYRPGDVVRVRKDLTVGHLYYMMSEHNHDAGKYHIVEDGHNYRWTDEMFDGPAEEIEVPSDEETLAFLGTN